MAPSAGEAAARSRPRPAALACQNCRHKHVKCDGGRPTCSRCSSAGAACIYLPSRRGQPARFDASHTTPLPPNSAHHLPATPIATSPAEYVDPQPNEAAGAPNLTTPETGALFTAADTHRLVGLYYSRFHPSHPMLVPRAYFSAQRYPTYLIAAMCVVGHYFTSCPPSTSLVQKAFSLATSEHEPESIHRIQALILCAVSFSASSQVLLADDCIHRAVRVSRTTNLHRLDTEDVPQVSPGEMMQRESFRRTWWELYLLDAISALLRHRKPSLPATSSGGMPLLPCSESLYETGECCSSNLSRQDFERRILLSTSDSFSSQSYRIHAASIVRSVCPFLATVDMDPAELEAAEMAIAIWNLDPPNACLTSPDASDGIDNILLQAHLYVQVAALFLHVPRSKLPLAASAPLDKTCLRSCSLDTGADDHHTIKSIAASNELCTVAGMPWLREGHSLLLTCGFILGCAVQLSLISGRFTPSLPQKIRQNKYQKVLLMLSALKYMGRTWPVARNALSQLQAVADATFQRERRSADDRSGGPADGSNGAGSSIWSETRVGYECATDNFTYNDTVWGDMDWFGLFTSMNENEDELSSLLM